MSSCRFRRWNGDSHRGQPARQERGSARVGPSVVADVPQRSGSVATGSRGRWTVGRAGIWAARS